MRLLGIDYGRRRTGLAISDGVGVTCRPLAVLTERDEARLASAVLAAAAKEEAEGVVVGMPRPLSGGTNQQMQDVLDFVERLRKQTTLPVTTWDERFTSVLAERGSRDASSRDAVAACYMLQNYLDMLSAAHRS